MEKYYSYVIVNNKHLNLMNYTFFSDELFVGLVHCGL
jgi:hypothetical protein